jgi:K(+)-stimulated pyrophosphate-energized sodium pump
MIFSIILILSRPSSTEALLAPQPDDAPVLLGFICGGAVIYWFCGASMQAVTTGAYRAVEFIKKNMNLNKTKPTSRTRRPSSRSAPSTRRPACGTSSSR